MNLNRFIISGKMYNQIFSIFFNLIFEEDTMGFIPVKRNIRISSEALLDLYNLVYVQDYDDPASNRGTGRHQ